MNPGLQDKEISSVPLREDDIFCLDVLSLFVGKVQGHMGVWEYAPELYKGDPAGGGAQWAALVRNPGAYYPVSAEQKMIRTSLRHKAFLNVLSRIEVVMEVGPGSPDSVSEKTVPFLQKCPLFRRYVAVDATAEQADDAARKVRDMFCCEAKTLKFDYNLHPLGKSCEGRCATVMWGNSLGNISGCSGENVFQKLVSILRNFSRGFSVGDIFAFCFDTENDKEKIVRAYSEKLLSQSILSILFRMKRDGVVTGRFAPEMWRHEPVWFPEVGQCAHTIYPTCDQELEIAGTVIPVPAGKRFISNNSYKFSPETVRFAAQKAGIQPLFCFREGPMAMFVGTR